MSRTALRPPMVPWAGVLACAATLLASPASAAPVKLARHPDYHDGTVVFS
jgi:hypothetical protein